MTLNSTTTAVETSNTQPYHKMDPREHMIATLSQQNQSLLDMIDAAQVVFQKNQSQQQEAIEKLSKTNDELRIALIQSQEQNKQLQQLHLAEIQALHEKYLLKIDTQNKAYEDLSQRCESMKRNVEIYEQGIQQMEKLLEDRTYGACGYMINQKYRVQIEKIRRQLGVLL